jgi:hypothetical protein
MRYNGEHVKDITYFPSEWSREKVVSKIYEAYNNVVKDRAQLQLNDKGKYHIIGITNEGVKIEMYITAKGKITTAYPTFE